MIDFLNRPYPFTFLPSRRIRQILPIWLVVILFLTLLKPFGLENNPDYIIFSVYMSSCGAIAGLITTVIIPLLFPLYFNEDKWTIKRNLIWVICINIIFAPIMFFALNGFLIYMYNAFDEFTVKNFFKWFYIQFAFGVPLGIVINLVNQNYLLKKYLKIAGNINHTGEKEKLKQVQTTLKHNKQNRIKNIEINPLEFEVDKSNKVTFEIENLIYVEALGNYINIVYHNKGNRKIIIRETISNLEQKISESELIYKPHRSYLVNLKYIENITGDSQGLKIHLKGFEKIIPVSRNKTKEFKMLVTANS